MAKTALGGNPINTVGDLPAVGSAAPNFNLTNGSLEDLHLSSFAGKRVILSVNPSLDTGVCATSLRTFNARAAGLEDTVMINVSRDLPFAAKRFCAAEGIENAHALSDLRGDTRFGDAYGLTLADGPMAGLLARAVVVLDADHKVAYTELVPEIAQEPNYDAAIAALG